ncbi:RNase H domain-containing protein [Trichonephila clavipes]|nr:RNase H domain-containing protein [Trichonephila clavipes]
MPIRRTDVKLTRRRIGHTRFTHRHLFLGENAPECPSCQVPYSVHYILIDCPVFNHHRILFFRTSILSLSNLVGEKNPPSKSLCILTCNWSRRRRSHSAEHVHSTTPRYYPHECSNSSSEAKRMPIDFNWPARLHSAEHLNASVKPKFWVHPEQPYLTEYAQESLQMKEDLHDANCPVPEYPPKNMIPSNPWQKNVNSRKP